MSGNPFPIPVSILTGFLGSGKTTLLNRLLKEPGLSDTAVIVNEWGEVAIDHLLIENVGRDVIELADGCLCCTVRGDMVDTLLMLTERVASGRGSFNRVVIETTGLADPAPVLQAMMEHPALVQAYKLDGLVTLVDAEHGSATLDGHPEARVQAAMADRLLLSKTDIASGETVDGLVERLRRLNPRAEVADIRDRAGSALLSAGLIDAGTRRADLSRWLGEHDHHGHASHGHSRHGGSDHGNDIQSFSLRHNRPIPFSAVETFFGLLRQTQGETLLRMKGVIELAEEPERPLVLHGVRTSLHPPAWLPGWPEGPRGSRLVLIGRGLDEDYVTRLFAAVTDRPAPDTPDRAALEENPLAVAGFRG